MAIGPRLAGPRKVPLDLRHGAWRLQPVIDALDFLAIVAERRRGAVSDPAAELMGSTAVVATALGSLLRRGRGAVAPGRLLVATQVALAADH